MLNKKVLRCGPSGRYSCLVDGDGSRSRCKYTRRRPIGAAIGHNTGGRDGAIVGGVLGAAVGNAITPRNNNDYYDNRNGAYYNRNSAYYDNRSSGYYQLGPGHYVLR